jgi:hypothetical protein
MLSCCQASTVDSSAEATPNSNAESDVPKVIYAPLAGRAELIRLIAAAGQLKIEDSQNMANFGTPTLEETGESKNNFVSPKGMPLLQHGNLKLSQSTAIESYIASVAPRYNSLTAQQRAVDDMYQGIKEELLQNCAKAVFTTAKADPDQAKKDVSELLDKWFGIFEEQVPTSGFINGLAFPTAADLALVNITRGFMPFGAAAKISGYDFEKWSKVKALCARAAADASVATYLSSSSTMAANPMGL